MSGRKLGGGRILGSGKGLAPPTPPAIQRASSPYGAPSSESTQSISATSSPRASISLSPGTSSPLPEFAQDLRSNISLGAGGPSNGGASESKLVCPICSEEMVCRSQSWE